MSGKDRPDVREAALEDPLRSSGGMHEASRLLREIAEFLRLALDGCIPAVIQHPDAPALRNALAKLEDALLAQALIPVNWPKHGNPSGRLRSG